MWVEPLKTFFDHREGATDCKVTQRCRFALQCCAMRRVWEQQSRRCTILQRSKNVEVLVTWRKLTCIHAVVHLKLNHDKMLLSQFEKMGTRGWRINQICNFSISLIFWLSNYVYEKKIFLTEPRTVFCVAWLVIINYSTGNTWPWQMEFAMSWPHYPIKLSNYTEWDQTEDKHTQ